MKSRAGTADASVRAGFIDMPDTGASNVMKRTMRDEQRIPVKGARRGRAELARTVVMRVNEMKSSATKAMEAPCDPGEVTT
jgi:hypothetical protein